MRRIFTTCSAYFLQAYQSSIYSEPRDRRAHCAHHRSMVRNHLVPSPASTDQYTCCEYRSAVRFMNTRIGQVARSRRDTKNQLQKDRRLTGRGRCTGQGVKVPGVVALVPNLTRARRQCLVDSFRCGEKCWERLGSELSR